MRSYIRHPSGMPINVRLDESNSNNPENLNNIGYGGLSFNSQTPMQPGMMVSLSVPVTHGEVESRGRVAWCHDVEGGGYEIGVEFMDAGDFYTVRMVEQVCHIEHYKESERQKQGRELSCQQAAEEWIEKYAADFPDPFTGQQYKHH